jgi:hypothetical protein
MFFTIQPQCFQITATEYKFFIFDIQGWQKVPEQPNIFFQVPLIQLKLCKLFMGIKNYFFRIGMADFLPPLGDGPSGVGEKS